MARPPEPRRSPLDDPTNAAHARARYFRMLRWMGWLAGTIVLAVWAILYAQFGFVSIHLYIATALGLGGMVMMVGALMGLVFLSSGTGHDAAIDNPLDDDDWHEGTGPD